MRRLSTGAVLVLLSGLGPGLRADEAEDRALRAVAKLGGKATRDEKAPGRPVVAIDLSFTTVKGPVLKQLASLEALRALDLSDTRIADGDLRELAGCKGLRKLDLSGTRVSDGGLRQLASLGQLQELRLGRTRTTGAGL